MGKGEAWGCGGGVRDNSGKGKKWEKDQKRTDKQRLKEKKVEGGGINKQIFLKFKIDTRINTEKQNRCRSGRFNCNKKKNAFRIIKMDNSWQ